MKNSAPVRFSVIGLNHGHVYSLTHTLLKAGGVLVDFYAPEKDLALKYSEHFPKARQVENENIILEDASILLVVSAGIPSERASLGIRAMQHGKDYLVDKPGFTSLKQLEECRRVQAKTRRIYSVFFSERLENGTSAKAGALIKAGAIGRVVSTTGLGPHRISVSGRPSWFFKKEKYGGILADLASHQMDQFLFYTGSTKAEIVSSAVANYKFPEYPGLEDFGECMVRGNRGTGYIRVDWYTPNGAADLGRRAPYYFGAGIGGLRIGDDQGRVGGLGQIGAVELPAVTHRSRANRGGGEGCCLAGNGGKACRLRRDDRRAVYHD